MIVLRQSSGPCTPQVHGPALEGFKRRETRGIQRIPRVSRQRVPAPPASGRRCGPGTGPRLVPHSGPIEQNHLGQWSFPAQQERNRPGTAMSPRRRAVPR